MKAWIQNTLIKKNMVNSGSLACPGEGTKFYAPGIEYRGEKADIKEKIFIKYPDRREGSGKKRIFISESGINPYFEIFVWEDNNQKVRIDFHYSIHDGERVLTWKINSGFVHSAVNSERPDVYGNKKIQTVAGQSDFIWTDLREKYIERMMATYSLFQNRLAASINAYNEIKEILDFILKTIDEKFY